MRLDVDGSEIFVGTGGRDFDPALPAVVFLHGAGMDHTVWALLARAFAHHGFAVLAPDLPGHGHSAGAALSSIAALADWTAAADRRGGRRRGRDSSVTPWDRSSPWRLPRGTPKRSPLSP